MPRPPKTILKLKWQSVQIIFQKLNLGLSWLEGRFLWFYKFGQSWCIIHKSQLWGKFWYLMKYAIFENCRYLLDHWEIWGFSKPAITCQYHKFAYFLDTIRISQGYQEYKNSISSISLSYPIVIFRNLPSIFYMAFPFTFYGVLPSTFFK